jgi:hypothetical protein
MCLHIRGHFDGRFIVPEQPVDLPVNQPLDIEVTSSSGNGTDAGAARQRVEKLKKFFARPPLGELPLDSLRRENLYDERA